MALLARFHRQHGWIWLALVALAAYGAGGWWWLGRPVPLPDAPWGRIACVSYAPFRLSGESPLDIHAFISPQRIDADLQALSQRFDCVRTYSQGQGLSAVPQIAQRHGMQVLLGIWLGSDRQANAEQIRHGISVAQQYPQVVRGVIVGNEVLLRGDLSEATLAGYVRQVRAAVRVPVSYADVWEFWLKHPALASAVDYITIHILPYWEDQPVGPEHAVQHVAMVYARVRAAFPGREVMIGETGWPSAGRPRQTAVPGVVNEARYLREFLDYAATVHMPYNVIEAFDQPWKRVLEGTAGGYWGIFDAQARPKFNMTGPVVEMPHWWLGWLAGVLGMGLFLACGARARSAGGARGWTALGLAGFASGAALAWQYRQLAFAARNNWEWTVGIAACGIALITALALARAIAARLVDPTQSRGKQSARAQPNVSRSDEMPAATHARLPAMNHSSAVAPGAWLCCGWLLALAYYGLLLVFDGRYRDYPLGLFALPGVGYTLLAWLGTRKAIMPLLEARFLACLVPVLAVIVVAQEHGITLAAWLWLMLNLALAWPVLHDWRQARLQAQQA
ncbi:MAG: glycoside hydrolase family 17 [Rhodanobacter sp.]